MNTTKILFIAFFLSIFFSCDKEDNEWSCDIYQNWEVMDFMSVESMAYSKDKGFNPVIEFKKDGSYFLKLDRNGCFGSFALTGENNIDISGAGCTKICCDSKFSLKFAEMLPKVISYSIKRNKMKLNVSGWGWIELEAVK